MQQGIGIFSGTFDPVHIGHVEFCRVALKRCGLSQVVLLPEVLPRGKVRITPLKHRMAMLELATQDDPRLQVLKLRSRRFSVTATLPELLRYFPGQPLVLLLGSDSAATLAYRWPGLEQLLLTTHLVIGLRRGDTAPDVAQLIRKLEEQYHCTIHYSCLPSPQAHASSSTARAGRQTDLDPRVAAYIAKQRLYGA